MQVQEILRVKGNRLCDRTSGQATDAVRTMAKENLGSLVVLERGRMVGMLTFHELLRALAARGGVLGDLVVGEIMDPDPVTATPDMEVNDLRRTMLESGARLPVMKDERASRRLVPRRGQGGARRAGFREPQPRATSRTRSSDRGASPRRYRASAVQGGCSRAFSRRAKFFA